MTISTFNKTCFLDFMERNMWILIQVIELTNYFAFTNKTTILKLYKTRLYFMERKIKEFSTDYCKTMLKNDAYLLDQLQN